MDECLVEVSLDISNRPYFIIHGEECFAGKAGDIELDLVLEFFRAVCVNAGITMHLTVYASGGPHHLAEASFKAFARAFQEAIRITGTDIPSTKHVL
jgi:imidazoleglycerol phosphate dehydratase HisB